MRTPFRPSALIPLAVALAFAAPASAQQAATGDPEVQAFVCDLSGDCGDASADQAAVPEHKGARSSATRGFTFKRTAPDPKAGAALAASTARPNAPAAAPARPAQPYTADLRLDFASASAELNPASRTRLGKLAAALSSPRIASRRIRIEGHTDASGNAVVNRQLSQKRAQAAADYLVTAGVSRSRIDVVGYGSSQPLPNVAANDPSQRRVVATLLN